MKQVFHPWKLIYASSEDSGKHSHSKFIQFAPIALVLASMGILKIGAGFQA